MSRIVAFAIAVVFFVVSAPVAAQVFADNEGADSDNQILYFSSATTTSTAVGIAIIVGTVVTITDDEEADHAERYLRENAVAIRTDLTLGAGETVDDLATFLRVPDSQLASFGRALRRRSADLLALADPDRLDTDRAARFLRIARRALAESIVRESTST